MSESDSGIETTKNKQKKRVQKEKKDPKNKKLQQSQAETKKKAAPKKKQTKKQKKQQSEEEYHIGESDCYDDNQETNDTTAEYINKNNQSSFLTDDESSNEQEDGDKKKTKPKKKKDETKKETKKPKEKGTTKNTKNKDTTKNKKEVEKYPGGNKKKVLDYMQRQNRPYSIINIMGNLHNTIKKKELEKIINALVSESELTEKIFGKAKIYLINQDNLEQVSQEEIKELDDELQEKRQFERNYLEQNKELNTQFQHFNKQQTNAQIEEEIKKYKELIQEQQPSLDVFESESYQHIDDETMTQVEKNLEKTEKLYKKYRRLLKDSVGQIAEGMEKKLVEVQDLLGLDMDEP